MLTSNDLNKDRYIILDHIRGLAVLMVLLFHWSKIFVDPASVANLLHFSRILENTDFGLLSKVSTFILSTSTSYWVFGVRFDSGGVLLFFLVSGFVIPMSLEKGGVVHFALRRVFRLLPTLWTVIFLNLLLYLLLFDIGYITVREYSFFHVIANMFLINDWFWFPSIDIGFWTLLVEVKFYFLIGCLYILTGKTNLLSVGGLATFLFLLSLPFQDFAGVSDYDYLLNFSAQSGYDWVFYFYRVLNDASPFIIYMLIGTVIFLYYQKRVTLGAAIICCAVLYVFFATSFLISPNGTYQIYYVSDGFKILVFFVLMLAVASYECTSGRFYFLSIFLKYFGNISYSLYLVHSFFGMSIIYCIWMLFGSVDLAFVLGSFLVITITIFVNKFIEKPSISAGIWVCKFLKRRQYV